MGQLVLLVVAAAWAAVLIPPLLRSRIENRPNSSVTDFRNQLSSLQRAMPTRSTGPMRSMARPLAPSPLTRPAAAGRPTLRSGVRTHGTAKVASHEPTARAVRASTPVRAYDPAARSRTHRDRPGSDEHSIAQRRAATRAAPRPQVREVDAHQGVRRRRANVLFVLGLTAASSLFLAATTKATGMLYVFALAFLALCGYVYLLGQLRQREALERIVDVPARSTPSPVAPRRERVVRHDRSYAV